MKKSLFVLLGGMLLSAPLLFGTARYAALHAEGEEPDPIVDPVVDPVEITEKTYTCEGLSLTLKSDFTYHFENDGIKLDGTYSNHETEKHVVVLAMLDNIKYFELFEDGTCVEWFEPVEPEPEVFECSVKVETAKHGSIECDKMEGHVGDICLLTIKADTFYAVSEIKVNDVLVTVSEDGLYKFALVEGENVIISTFVVDPEIAGELSTIIDKAEKAGETGDFTDLFTFENVALLVNYLMNAGYGIALIITQIKSGKLKSVDRAEIIGTIQAVIPEKAQEIITDLVEKNVSPILEKVNIKCDDLAGAFKTFIQGFMYNLEGTDEAKQRVLEMLSKVNLSDDTTVSEVKQFFEEKISKMKADYDKRIELLEQMKAENERAQLVAENGATENLKEEDKKDISSLI